MVFCCFILIASISEVVHMKSTESSENLLLDIPSYDFPFVSRKDWLAREAKETTRLKVPVPYVVIHHSYIPKRCNTTKECVKAMQSMQNYHMDDRGWWDIGYHFGVGSDGAVYEGRGWKTLGAHALHFNTISIGICLIGDWTKHLPPVEQIQVTNDLITVGVNSGYIKPDYKLVGHRQVRDTECPGETLHQHIKTWKHYSPHPSSVAELPYVEELSQELKNLVNQELKINN